MKDKSIYIIIVVVVIVALGLWLWLDQPVSNAPAVGISPEEDVAAPQENESTTSSQSAVTERDNTGSINQDLNSVNVEDPDFQSIDSDLNSL